MVPRSDDDVCTSLFMITLNDSGLLCLRAQVPEDTGDIEVFTSSITSDPNKSMWGSRYCSVTFIRPVCMF